MFVKSAISLYGNMQSRRILQADILTVDNLYQNLDTDATPRMKKKVTFRGLSLLKEGSVTENLKNVEELVNDINSNPTNTNEIKSQCDIIPEAKSNAITKESSNHLADGTNGKQIPKNGHSKSNNAVKNHWSGLNLSEEKIDLPQISTTKEKENMGTVNNDIKVPENIADENVTLEISASVGTPKKSLNIHDFQNTTIEKVLNSNINIAKILSTERVPKENGVTETKNGNHVEKNGEGVVGDSHESNIDSSADCTDLAAPGNDQCEGVSGSDEVERGSGVSDGMTNIEDDSSDSTDVSDPDTSCLSDDKGHYTENECIEPMRGNLMDRMKQLNKEESAIYFKIVKVCTYCCTYNHSLAHPYIFLFHLIVVLKNIEIVPTHMPAWQQSTHSILPLSTFCSHINNNLFSIITTVGGRYECIWKL